MAEMLKACRQHESSRLPMVGFLSVLAISGSVALISFMGKLRQAAVLSQGDLQPPQAEENEHSPPHLPSLKRKKKVRFASDVLEPPSNGHQYRSKWRVSHRCHKHAHLDVPSNDQVLAMHKPPLSHPQHYKSKPTVPQGHATPAYSAVDKPPCNDRVFQDESTYNDQQYKLTCKVSQRNETHAHLSCHQKPSKSRKDSRGCEVHSCLLHPPMPSKSPSSIPANRLALYKGLRQSRLQYSLHGL